MIATRLLLKQALLSFCGLAMLLGLGTPAMALAQGDRAALAGTVIDEIGGGPLGGVRVSLEGLDSATLTDDRGTFFLQLEAAGPVTLRVALEGYVTAVESFEVSPGENSLGELRLLRLSAALNELLITGDRDRWQSGSSEARVYVRTEDGGQVQGSAADLLSSRVPGLDLRRNTGSAGGGARVQSRGSSSLVGNEPTIYLDGVRISSRTAGLDSRGSSGLHALEMIPASSIAVIRVLRGPSAAALYPEAANGVILIESTNRIP